MKSVAVNLIFGYNVSSELVCTVSVLVKGYMSAREVSDKWGISESRAHKLCQQGRIPGLERFGRSWAIPKEAKKPNNPRFTKSQPKIPAGKEDS